MLGTGLLGTEDTAVSTTTGSQSGNHPGSEREGQRDGRRNKRRGADWNKSYEGTAGAGAAVRVSRAQQKPGPGKSSLERSLQAEGKAAVRARKGDRAWQVWEMTRKLE